VRTIHRLLAGPALMTLAIVPLAVQAQVADAGSSRGAADEGPVAGEIVVTASKRAERLLDVPIAITAISGDALARPGSIDFSSFAAKAPGLAFTRRGPSQNRLSIRGLTSFAGIDNEFPMVGLYIDEVPISDNAAPDFGLYDLERVEVLRGPQGTLYGEGSMGGTVRYVTRQPVFDRVEGSLNGEVSGTKDGGSNWRGNGVINLPIATDRAALRVSGWYERDGGFVDNLALGEKNADRYRRYGLRGALRLAPADGLTVTLSGAYQRFTSGIEPVVFRKEIPGLTPPLLTRFGDTVGYRQVRERTRDKVWYGNLTIGYDLGTAALTLATSYYQRRLDGLNDEVNTSRGVEAGFAPIAEAFGVSPFYLTNGTQVRFDTRRQVFAQEVRLVSTDKGPLKWTVGGYFSWRKFSNFADARAPDVTALTQFINPDYQGELQQADATTRFRQFAVFGEVTYSVLPRLDLIAGGRWFTQSTRGDQRITVPSFDFAGGTFGTIQDIVLPSLTTTEKRGLFKAGFAWRPTDRTNVYGTVSQGYRPGGVNPRFNPLVSDAVSPRAFQSDRAISYELGAKAELFDRALSANAAVYRTVLSNAQFLDPRDPSFNVVRNAARAWVDGIELELTAKLGRELTLGASGSLIDARFKGNALEIAPGQFLIANNQRLPITRRGTFAFTLDWRHPMSDTLTLAAGAEAVRTSSALANTTRPDTDTGGLFEVLDPYTLIDLRAGVETARWSVTAFVKNLTDRTAELGGQGAFGISRNKPRTIGVRAGLTF